MNWSNHLQTQMHHDAKVACKASEVTTTLQAETCRQAKTIPLLTVPHSMSDISGCLEPIFTGSINPTEDINRVSAGDFHFTPQEQVAYFPGEMDQMFKSKWLEKLLHAEFQRLLLALLEKELGNNGAAEVEEPDASASFHSLDAVDTDSDLCK